MVKSILYLEFQGKKTPKQQRNLQPDQCTNTSQALFLILAQDTVYPCNWQYIQSFGMLIRLLLFNKKPEARNELQLL